MHLGTKMNSLDFEVKGQRSQRDHIQSNKKFGSHFLGYLRNANTYFNKPYQNYSLPLGIYDIDDSSSLMG